MKPKHSLISAVLITLVMVGPPAAFGVISGWDFWIASSYAFAAAAVSGIVTENILTSRTARRPHTPRPVP
jgi:hypothetical protein